jgi:hypothetical protein
MLGKFSLITTPYSVKKQNSSLHLTLNTTGQNGSSVRILANLGAFSGGDWVGGLAIVTNGNNSIERVCDVLCTLSPSCHNL